VLLLVSVPFPAMVLLPVSVPLATAGNVALALASNGAQPQAQRFGAIGVRLQNCDGEGETLLDGVTDGVGLRVPERVAVMLRVGVAEAVADGGITQVWFTMYAHTLGHVHAPAVAL
jgi:hypothetical protein